MKGVYGMGYKVDIALGDHIIVEPAEKSTVLKAEEISTIFRVVAFPFLSKIGSYAKSEVHFNIGDLIIVEQGSVQKVKMGGKDVCYVQESDVVAKIKVDDDPAKT